MNCASADCALNKIDDKKWGLSCLE
jgi:hypothetical protein